MPEKSIRLKALQRQVDRLDRRLAALHRLTDRYSWLRVTVFGVGLVASFTAYFVVGAWLFWLLLALSVALFSLVIYLHRRVEQGQRRLTLARDVKREQLARAHVAWADLPAAQATDPRYDHPFEGDLDLVGPHSLHHLLDTTRSVGGCQRLRAWLTATAPAGENNGEPTVETIHARQALVAELTPRSLYRLRLIIGGSGSGTEDDRWHPETLLTWLDAHRSAERMGPRLLLLALLAALNLVAVAAAVLGWSGTAWWPYTFAVYFGLYMFLSSSARSVFQEATTLQGAVEQLAGVMRSVEAFNYARTPHLRRLCAPFLGQATRPSHQLGRVKRVAAATGVQGNPLIWFVLNAAVPWDYFFARQLNRYKAEIAASAPGWLDAWADLEAASALANLAYLNPRYTLPTVTATTPVGEPVFSAHALGHPLLADDVSVRNDFRIDRLGDVAILTGSNMAGKSTFLKSLGVNLALAYAGGPVDAAGMRTDLFRLFTCIKVSDSVTDGISYFYAEVKRLKALLDALDQADAQPLFFCIDEIFRGTNNRERLAGSRAYIRTLVGKHGVGLISTHDLDLVKLADEIGQVRNYHFRDAIEDERMVFDYQLRAGPCPTTNALKIMALEGLPVQVEEPSRQETA